MDSAQPPAPSRRTLLRGAALSALTTVALLAAAPPQTVAAAVPDRPRTHKPDSKPHPSYRAIIGLL
ncbi:hypothetical protein [Streptomyces sp. NRRL S-813]|uniref:hypothetical protein n=1 Tax=Streptomyces sp. NRRL S-813 TaxID=1463919 RepID=UPI0004C2A80E|nr:hypothetical protein [Streptomyces sp. NRRL S-813]